MNTLKRRGAQRNRGDPEGRTTTPKRQWTIVHGPSEFDERRLRIPAAFTVLDSHSVRGTVDVRLESVSDKKDDIESRTFRGRLKLKGRAIKVIGLYSSVLKRGSMEED